MHWFGSNTTAVVLGLVGSLWGPCLPLRGAPVAQVADTPEKRGGRSERDAHPADWGARLSVSPKGPPAAQKGTNVAAGDPAGRSLEPTPLAIPLVQGYDSFGLSLPDHDLGGRLRSLFVIGAISRIDDRNVEIRESFLETYAEDGSPEFSLELPKATLDRFTRVLVAKTPVTLRKAEFELKGASLEFNTVTKEGGLGGPVQMTIYNGVASASPNKAASPNPSPRAASPAPK